MITFGTKSRVSYDNPKKIFSYYGPQWEMLKCEYGAVGRRVEWVAADGDLHTVYFIRHLADWTDKGRLWEVVEYEAFKSWVRNYGQ